MAKDGYGYAASLAQRLNRTVRTINKHLRKLERANLVQRHGNRKCPFQWYSLNERAKDVIKHLVSYLIENLKARSQKGLCYVPFKILLDQVPSRRPVTILQHGINTFPIATPRQYRDPGRPYDRSLPYVCFCTRGGACPFPVCVRGLNKVWNVGRALIERAEQWKKAYLYDPP